MNIEPRKYRKTAVLERDLLGGIIENLNEWDHVVRQKCDSSQKTGQIVPTQQTAFIALTRHPYFFDCLGYSVLDECVMILRPLPCIGDDIPPNGTGRSYPRRYDDDDLIWLTMALNLVFSDLAAQFKKNIVDDAVKVAAHQNTYNPIEVYLKSLQWDETRRLKVWLNKALGAADTEINAVMGMKFLIASVRRVIKRDGHKFDSMLILEGPKGIQKSSICKLLFGGDKYFMEGVGNIRAPELPEKLSGIWAAEIPELVGFRNQDPQVQKEFLSKTSDTLRRPYLRHPSTYPRRCVFIGTVNDQQYLQEAGADRRFWPVECNVAGPTDIQWLKDNRDQIWAEAYLVAKSDTMDFLSPEEMQELSFLQGDRTVVDPWSSIVLDWLNTTAKEMKEIHMTSVLNEALSIPRERQDKKCSIRAGTVLSNLGLIKKRARRGGNMIYYYTRA